MKRILLILVSVISLSNVMVAQEMDLAVADSTALDSAVIDSTVLDSVLAEAFDTVVVPKTKCAIDYFVLAPTDVVALYGYARTELYEMAVGEAFLNDGDSSRVIKNDCTNFELEVAPNFKYQLVMPKEGVLMMITTHAIPAQDSEIVFYDYNWEQLPTGDYLKTPKLSDWLTKEGKKNRKKVEDAVKFLVVKSHYDEDSKILTLTNNLQGQFIPSEWEKISSYMKSEIRYEWNGKKFKQLK